MTAATTTRTTPTPLDLLVRACTAFSGWTELITACEGGYIPTLNGGDNYARLARFVRRNGFKVYRNGRVA